MSGKHYDEKSAQIMIRLLKAHGEDCWAWQKWYSTRQMKVDSAGAHLRNSPQSLMVFGNNYLKQLAFGARANSPVPICQSSNYHDSECSRCAHRIMLFLKVIMVVSNLKTHG